MMKSRQVWMNLPYRIFAWPICTCRPVKSQAAEQRADPRHDDVADQRGDDLAERRADDHADRQVDGVSLDRELAELLDDAHR